MENKAEIEKIIQKACDILETAKYGYDDLVGKNKSRKFSGIRNLVVFGRSVTFVLQNLKTPVGSERFNNWYEPKQEKMKNSPVMKFFVQVRNEILKQGQMNISTSAHIHNFSTDDMRKFQPKPRGATGFFMGDNFGGSGWEVTLDNGEIIKYYVEIPTEIAEIKQVFSDLKLPENDPNTGKSVEELAKYYLSELENLIDSAREEFLNSKRETIGSIKLPAGWKVIK